ncbi:MAG: glycosyltransferase family 2 protein [Bacteroidota bacterium]
MNFLTITFWLCLFTVFYTYFGYGVVLYIILRIKRLIVPTRLFANKDFEPHITFIVPCYNEADILEDKILNSLSLDYPKHKIEFIFITDGSDDGSDDVVKNYDAVKLMHQPQRKGKSAAENRSVSQAKGEIIIFSDANTLLPSNAVRHLVKHYADPLIGAVSGEKRIHQSGKENAAGAGEGFYWKYESKLKKWDAELYSIVGAAGELFSFRRNLYIKLEEDTILDDFMLSLRIAARGYKVHYEPEAIAMETSSANSKEELKRKIRICAGGWQAMTRLPFLLNPVNDPLLTFQYISHRVLRWSVAPLFMIILFAVNVPLAFQSTFYSMMLIAQLAFYVAAGSGLMLEKRQIRMKLLFIPYYFCMMNYAAVAGFFRFAGSKQSAIWERSERKVVTGGLTPEVLVRK